MSLCPLSQFLIAKLICFSGDGLWNDLAMEVQGVETTYNQMPQVMSAKTNAQQLEQFSKTFML